MQPPVAGKRFLIVRLGAIGDVLRVLPAGRRLRRSVPDAHIGWVVEHWAYPVVAGNPIVDRFHVLDRRALAGGWLRAARELRRLLQEIKAERYDVLLDFHGRLKSGLLGRATGIGQRIGFSREDATEGNHLFTNVHVRLADGWENRVLRFLHLLEPLGIDAHYDPAEHGIYIEPETRRAAREWYDSVRRPPVAVYPGTSKRRERERWPQKKWVDLLRRLGGSGISSVVFWGPDDEALARDIVDAAGRHAKLAPPTTLPELMAMIGCFRTFIGSDTAAMHMAWMQGVPTGAFIGPKPSRTAAPLAPVPSYVLRAEEYWRNELRPSRQPAEIVTAVPVGEALEAIDQLLEAASPRGGDRPTKGA